LEIPPKTIDNTTRPVAGQSGSWPALLDFTNFRFRRRLENKADCVPRRKESLLSALGFVGKPLCLMYFGAIKNHKLCYNAESL